MVLDSTIPFIFDLAEFLQSYWTLPGNFPPSIFFRFDSSASPYECKYIKINSTASPQSQARTEQ
jgi:hypothetical protein